MKIKKLIFEKKEIEVKETYVDENGKIRERIKKVLIPTGKCLGTAEEDEIDHVADTEDKSK